MDVIRSFIFRSRGSMVAGILVLALIAFELFNFSTTEFALAALIGQGTVLGISWGSILAVAFCGIDLAGVARLFTPERGREEPKEVGSLLGAWGLGATMNAAMTWWAVLNSLLDQPIGNEFVTRDQLLTIVPIAVAALVWLTRVLLIGSLTVAGEHLLYISGPRGRTAYSRPARALGSGSSRYVQEPQRVRELGSAHQERPPAYDRSTSYGQPTYDRGGYEREAQRYRRPSGPVYEDTPEEAARKQQGTFRQRTTASTVKTVPRNKKSASRYRARSSSSRRSSYNRRYR